mgnify:CR=1 FL=1
MKKRGTLFGIAVLFSCLLVTAVAAQNYDIKTMTPEIKAALDARRARFDELADLKAEGIIGENNSGYVEILAPSPRAQELAPNENRDRRLIYKAIAEQNGLTGALNTIETVFAKVQREKAAPGDPIQLPGGEWVKK